MEPDAIKFESENTVPACPFPAQSNNLNLTTNNFSTIEDNSSFYDVHDNRKRIAVVFNQHEFDTFEYLGKPLSLSTRKGTDKDKEKIIKSLEELKFKVTPLQDPTKSDIDNEIKKVAAMTSKEVSCVVVVVMTHGDPGGILFAKDDAYSKDILFNPFKNAHKLVGVPKVFIFQACRGKSADPGHQVEPDGLDPKETINEEPHPVPSMADMLWVYSTCENYVSWREEDGSWFIQTLCKVLDKYGKQLDILQILTQVNFKVAHNFTSNTPKEIKSHDKKQMPQIEFTLTKTLSFKPINE